MCKAFHISTSCSRVNVMGAKVELHTHRGSVDIISSNPASDLRRLVSDCQDTDCYRCEVAPCLNILAPEQQGRC